jgi:hypothetical protein
MSNAMALDHQLVEFVPQGIEVLAPSPLAVLEVQDEVDLHAVELGQAAFCEAQAAFFLDCWRAAKSCQRRRLNQIPGQHRTGQGRRKSECDIRNRCHVSQ